MLLRIAIRVAMAMETPKEEDALMASPVGCAPVCSPPGSAGGETQLVPFSGSQASEAPTIPADLQSVFNAAAGSDLAAAAASNDTKTEDLSAEADVDAAMKSEVKEQSDEEIDWSSERSFSKVKEYLASCFTKMQMKYGGPAQYLQQKYATAEQREKFAQDLDWLLPPLPTTSYVPPPSQWSALQFRPGQGRVHLHPAMLGYDLQCTTKPLPFSNTCQSLADEILAHGFLTETDTLAIWMSGSADIPNVFWTRYVKGMARSCTLLALLSLVIERKLSMMTLPQLLTASVVIAVVENHTDLASVAIANANFAARGSIRQAHDVLTWVMKLRLLETSRANDPKVILDRFNAQASRRAQLVGQKRTSALNLLQSGRRLGVDLMRDLLSELGPLHIWWNEDTWSNKKLLPGFQPRLKLAKWSQALTVTPKSFALMIRALNQQQRKKLPKLRRKLDKEQIEDQAQVSALLQWVCACACSDVPALAPACEVAQDHFCDGEITICLDLQSLLHEKKNEISWQDLAFLRKSHADVVKSSDLQVTGRAVTQVEAGRLDEMEFNLFKEKLEFDVAQVKVWRSKLACHESMVYHAKMDQKRKRRVDARQAAESLTEGRAPAFSFVDAGAATPAEMLENFSRLCSEIRREHHVPPQTDLLALVYVNHCAPSQHSMEESATQKALLPNILGKDGIDGLGVLCMPVWERKKGMLFQAENLILKDLANMNLNSDEKASISFEASTG